MRREIALVGTPNVGKSVIFNFLTGAYVSVSNYPGTTVEITRGVCRLGGREYSVVDTPGLYSLQTLTEEERVTRTLLLRRRPDVAVHVADAKNIGRMLAMTLELLDAGLPVILTLNLMDEAEAAGVRINCGLLAELLGIPVVPTAAVKKIGLDRLAKAIGGYLPKPAKPFRFSDGIEEAVAAVGERLHGDYGLSRRMVALLLLQEDKGIDAAVRQEREYEAICGLVRQASGLYKEGMAQRIAMERQAMAEKLVAACARQGTVRRRGWPDLLDRLAREPVTGLPLLLLVLYCGLYKFVGGFGAGFLVDFIDDRVFAGLVTPWVNYAAGRFLPWEWLSSLLVGEYGLYTMGVRYAVAIIIPIVGTFFLTFAALEDCGYLPRAAMLMDGVFRRLGLNGRAVIPVTLGLGCGTMAVVVTRTLETRRERVLGTFLLALAVPCSAQLGLVLALLSHNSFILSIWAGYILAVFALAGWLGAKLLPGERSAFYMEMPPLRLPSLSNVVTKAYTRMVWYFWEIVPVFIIASILLWLGDRCGFLAYVIERMEPVMASLGLPRELAGAFLLGFFRRDYGTAGLYDMAGRGALSDEQLLVAAVTLTLFVPCVAQFMVMLKERGVPATVVMIGIIAVTAFVSGWLVHQAAEFFG